jgi:hypothetical protein
VDKLLSGVPIMDATSGDSSMSLETEGSSPSGSGESFLAAYEPRRRSRARAAALFASDSVNTGTTGDGTSTGSHALGALFIDTMLQLVGCHKQLVYPPPNLDR